MSDFDKSRFNFEELFDAPEGVPLPDDGENDDRTDSALKSRTESFAAADNLNWLDGQLDNAEGENSRFNPRVDIAASPSSPRRTPEPLEEGEGSIRDKAVSVLSDMGGGIQESYKQIPGGVLDAVNSILKLTETISPPELGGVQFFNFDGEWDFELLNAEELARRREQGEGFQLPTTPDPKTTTGGLTRAISQFLVPYAKASKVLKVRQATTTTGTVGRAMAAGAVADFLAFEGQEERLSNLVQEHLPEEAQNIVTDYLAADEDDSELEGRMKNAIEGLALGVVGEAFFQGIRTFKHWRRLRRDANSKELEAEAIRTAEAEQVLRDAGQLNRLGDTREGAALTQRINRKAKAAVAETETGVPDQVTAKALKPKGFVHTDAVGSGQYTATKINPDGTFSEKAFSNKNEAMAWAGTSKLSLPGTVQEAKVEATIGGLINEAPAGGAAKKDSLTTANEPIPPSQAMAKEASVVGTLTRSFPGIHMDQPRMDLREAVEMYSSSYFNDINEWARHGKAPKPRTKEDLQRLSRAIRALYEGARPLAQDTVVYRGQRGLALPDSGFVSVTTRRKIAKDFAGEENVEEIVLPKGTRVVNLAEGGFKDSSGNTSNPSPT